MLSWLLRGLPKPTWSNACCSTKDAVEGLDGSKPGSRTYTIRRQVGLDKQSFGPLQPAFSNLGTDRATNRPSKSSLEGSPRNTCVFDDIGNTDGLPGAV